MLLIRGTDDDLWGEKTLIVKKEEKRKLLIQRMKVSKD